MRYVEDNTQRAIGFMKILKASYAQAYPDRTDRFYIPRETIRDKTEAYNMYKRGVEEDAPDSETAAQLMVSESTFLRLWKQHFSNVTIQKHTPFSKCDVCLTLKSHIQLAVTPGAKAYYQSLFDAHMTAVKEERNKYYEIK